MYMIPFGLHNSCWSRYYLYLDTEEKEEQRRPVTHPRPHSWKMVELKLESGLASLAGSEIPGDEGWWEGQEEGSCVPTYDSLTLTSIHTGEPTCSLEEEAST